MPLAKAGESKAGEVPAGDSTSISSGALSVTASASTSVAASATTSESASVSTQSTVSIREGIPSNALIRVGQARVGERNGAILANVSASMTASAQVHAKESFQQNPSQATIRVGHARVGEKNGEILKQTSMSMSAASTPDVVDEAIASETPSIQALTTITTTELPGELERGTATFTTTVDPLSETTTASETPILDVERIYRIIDTAETFESPSMTRDVSFLTFDRSGFFLQPSTVNATVTIDPLVESGLVFENGVMDVQTAFAAIGFATLAESMQADATSSQDILEAGIADDDLLVNTSTQLDLDDLTGFLITAAMPPVSTTVDAVETGQATESPTIDSTATVTAADIARAAPVIDLLVRTSYELNEIHLAIDNPSLQSRTRFGGPNETGLAFESTESTATAAHTVGEAGLAFESWEQTTTSSFTTGEKGLVAPSISITANTSFGTVDIGRALEASDTTISGVFDTADTALAFEDGALVAQHEFTFEEIHLAPESGSITSSVLQDVVETGFASEYSIVVHETLYDVNDTGLAFEDGTSSATVLFVGDEAVIFTIGDHVVVIGEPQEPNEYLLGNEVEYELANREDEIYYFTER